MTHRTHSHLERLSRSLMSLALLAVVAPVTADTLAHEETVTIRAEAGQTSQELYGEILKAARKACSSRAVYPHRHRPVRMNCQQRFVADAVTAFRRPELTALHVERTRPETRRLADAD